MILSILIPSIPERNEKLKLLVSELLNQRRALRENHPTLGQVEIICHPGPKFLNGGLSVGKKREWLVSQATGKYLCFLDDDDKIYPNYLEELVRACNEGPDVVTFKSLFTCDYYATVVSMRLGQDNDEATPYSDVNRNAWHICPVLSSIAKKHEFKDINDAEDWDWFERLLPELNSEIHVPAILHNYNHSSLNSEVENIKRNEAINTNTVD